MIRLVLLLGILAGCQGAPKKDGGGDTPVENGEPKSPVTVVFEGVENFSERELRFAALREVREYEKTRRAADAADAAWAMEGALLDEGYAHAKVDFRIEGDTLRFLVAEGPRAYFAMLRFTGVRHIDVDTLHRYFEFPSTGFMGTELPVFREGLIGSAAAEVERHYLLNGYLDVVVDPPVVTWNEDRTKASVVVGIAEGRRYVVVAVEAYGVEAAPLDVVGKPYHPRLPIEAAARMRRKLYDKGHQYAKVDSSFLIDRKQALVTIRLDVVPGPVVKLRKLTIKGQKRTRTGFLRGLIPLEEGDVLAQKMIDAGRSNLYKSGLFSALYTNISRVADDQVDVELEVVENKSRNIDLEAGWGSYERLRGAVRYTDNNIFGVGRRFDARLFASTRTLGLDGTVTDPWLLGDIYRLELTGGASFREEPSFDRLSYYAGLTVVRRAINGVTLRAGYLWKNEEAQNVSETLPPEIEQEFVTSAGLFFSARIDKTDDILAPTRGWLVDGSVAYSAPALGADLHYFDLAFRGAIYINIKDRNVFAVGIGFQSRPILDDRPTLPIQERLFLGGDNTVRSYGRDELGPSVGGSPLGGLTRLWFSAELRTQLWEDLFSAVFYDVGMVSENALSIDGPPGHGIGGRPALHASDRTDPPRRRLQPGRTLRRGPPLADPSQRGIQFLVPLDCRGHGEGTCRPAPGSPASVTARDDARARFLLRVAQARPAARALHAAGALDARQLDGQHVQGPDQVARQAGVYRPGVLPREAVRRCAEGRRRGRAQARTGGHRVLLRERIPAALRRVRRRRDPGVRARRSWPRASACRRSTASRPTVTGTSRCRACTRC